MSDEAGSWVYTSRSTRPIRSLAASTSGYAPAATAAWIADPSAGPWSDAIVEIGIRSTSEYNCIRGRFFSRPPATTNSRTGTPASRNVSTIMRAPKAVASSSAR